MPAQRVVSKRTKLLFIGFGAAAIAATCIVYTTPGPQKADARTPKSGAITATAVPSK